MQISRRSTALAVAVVALVGCGGPRPSGTHPPDGRIAFVVTTGPGAEVRITNADGTGQTRLASGAGRGLSWSPDGSRIVFSSNPGISVMDADGTHLTQLATVGESPAWSPDGHRIAFSVRPNEGISPGDSPDDKSISALKESDIEVMNVDGSGITRLTSGWGDSAPAWLPDGQSVAFAREPLSDRTESGGCQGICAIGLDGSGLRSLGDLGDGPAWAPDGRTLAFVTSSGSSSLITLVNADGSGRRSLTPPLTGEIDFPAWSPDGRRIAFAYRRGVTDVFGTTTYGKSAIYVIDVDGTNLIRLSNDADSIQGLSWR